MHVQNLFSNAKLQYKTKIHYLQLKEILLRIFVQFLHFQAKNIWEVCSFLKV